MATVLISTACQQSVAVDLADDAATSVPSPSPVPTMSPPETPPPSVEPSIAEPEPTATPPVVATPTSVPAPEPTPPAGPSVLDVSAIAPVLCPPDVAASGVDCLIAALPLDASNPDPAELVELMIARVDNGDPAEAGPIVYLQGGPGIGSVTSAKRFVGGQFDVVFVDQRGTGYSSPRLDCPEVRGLWQAGFTDDQATRLQDDGTAYRDAYRDCQQRLVAEGISLDDFHTGAAATDIDILRQLLGYDQWSLWGSSYGTRIGLTIMRDHPEGVRAAVLDSVVPFEVDFFATLPEHGFRSITALDQACDESVCAQNHGDFLDTFSELVRRVDDDPVVVQATRPVTGATFPFRVDGEVLIDMVFSQLYSTSSLRALPRQIARADFGGIDEIVASYVTRRDPASFDLAEGLYYTTWCREEFPFYDASADDVFLDGVRPLFGGALERALGNDGVDSLCEIFDVEAGPPIDDEPLVSDIPTLVFAGHFDPVTPPLWSRQVADSLTNATFVEMPDHGHGMATACPNNIRRAFLLNPTSELDISCAVATGPPAFE